MATQRKYLQLMVKHTKPHGHRIVSLVVAVVNVTDVCTLFLIKLLNGDAGEELLNGDAGDVRECQDIIPYMQIQTLCLLQGCTIIGQCQ